MFSQFLVVDTWMYWWMWSGPICVNVDEGGLTAGASASSLNEVCRCPLGFRSLTLTLPGNSWAGEQILMTHRCLVNLAYIFLSGSCLVLVSFWLPGWCSSLSELLNSIFRECLKFKKCLGEALGPCEICPRGTTQPTEGSRQCISCPPSPLMTTTTRYTEDPTWAWQVKNLNV